jgi:hypothetical protein
MQQFSPFRLTAAEYALSADDDARLALLGSGENEPKKEREKRSKLEQITNPYEHEVQCRIVNGLRLLLPLDYIVCSFRAESYDPAVRRRSKEAGYIAGYAETHVIGDSRLWLMEIKDRDGRLSDDQKRVHPRIIAAGIPLLRICRSLDQAVAFLQENGARFRGRIAA